MNRSAIGLQPSESDMSSLEELPRHEATFNSFVRAISIGIIAITGLLALMALFLV